MKYNTYPLIGLSGKAVKKLPEILDKAGYKDRYRITAYGELAIHSTVTRVRKFLEEAENAVHEEDGYLVTVRQTAYRQMWISKKEAATLKDAYNKAIEISENGGGIDNDPEYAVACPADSPIYGSQSYRSKKFVEYTPY